MRGIGRVQLTTVIVLISYYVFALPFAYIFAFYVGSRVDSESQETLQGLGLNGLWYGLIVGQGILCLSYQFFISFKTDWQALVREAK